MANSDCAGTGTVVVVVVAVLLLLLLLFLQCNAVVYNAISDDDVKQLFCLFCY